MPGQTQVNLRKYVLIQGFFRGSQGVQINALAKIVEFRVSLGVMRR